MQWFLVVIKYGVTLIPVRMAGPRTGAGWRINPMSARGGVLAVTWSCSHTLGVNHRLSSVTRRRRHSLSSNPVTKHSQSLSGCCDWLNDLYLNNQSALWISCYLRTACREDTRTLIGTCDDRCDRYSTSGVCLIICNRIYWSLFIE
jgi:hypothetical protein